MKLTTVTHVSLDGVMQGLGGQNEDRRGGFERGGSALPLFDDEVATITGEIYQRADAFMFGRRTFDIFARSWGTGAWGADQGDNPISAALNTRPKFVVSTTLTEPGWADTTVLSGDVAATIGELRDDPPGELQVHGSGGVIRWLLENSLVDEITLLTYPVVVGKGTRLFPRPARTPPSSCSIPRSLAAGSSTRCTGWPDARITHHEVTYRLRLRSQRAVAIGEQA